VRYFIHLSYDGTNYCGWQVQSNAPSVQQTINEALEKLLGHHIKSMGCGRTDTGVHAKDFYMHFDAEKEIADTANFLFRLNCVLPRDINTFSIFPVADNANTRFNATQRTYEYYIHFNKSPFIHKYSYFQGFYHIEWEKVLEATEFLKTVTDFTSLCLPSIDFKTNICLVSRADWDVLPSHHFIHKPFEEEAAFQKLNPTEHRQFSGEQCVRFCISSNRFLRGMVRKTVGTLLMIGKGKLELNEFKDTVAEKKDFRVHFLAPPNGLFLSKVVYPEFEKSSN
jgi:tRNA pseudouridine38-40 synthase